MKKEYNKEHLKRKLSLKGRTWKTLYNLMKKRTSSIPSWIIIEKQGYFARV